MQTIFFPCCANPSQNVSHEHELHADGASDFFPGAPCNFFFHFWYFGNHSKRSKVTHNFAPCFTLLHNILLHRINPPKVSRPPCATGQGGGLAPEDELSMVREQNVLLKEEILRQKQKEEAKALLQSAKAAARRPPPPLPPAPFMRSHGARRNASNCRK